MANNYSPKRQALLDMKEEGLDVTLIERTQIVFTPNGIAVITEGILVPIGNIVNNAEHVDYEEIY